MENNSNNNNNNASVDSIMSKWEAFFDGLVKNINFIFPNIAI